LIIPGGKGRVIQSTHAPTLQFIQRQFAGTKLVLSVCTGAFILYHAGVLKDEKITTYWRALPELYALKDVQVQEQRVVKSGKIRASGGISSGIDLALDVIAETAGKETAGKVQLLFEYFPENNLYADKQSINHLPAYMNHLQSDHLAEYIGKILEKS
jgi:transcriptional regulator GlxA family with amidase domain